MGSKAKKMYENPPKIERDDKGHVSVAKPKEADVVQGGTEGVGDHVKEAHTMMDMHHRHEMEHMAMNRRHEVEHHASKGDAAMVEKHVSEHKEMNMRHVGELKKAMSRKGKGDESAETKEGKTKLEEPKAKKKAKAVESGEKA